MVDDRLMSPREIEPQLLVMFRVFVGVTMLLNIIGNVLFYLAFDVFLPFLYMVPILIWGGVFVYLHFSQLRQILGRFYLPIALTVTTLAIIGSQRLTSYTYPLREYLAEVMVDVDLVLPAQDNPLNTGDSWLIFLFVPLVFIAWQYGFRMVGLFTGVTALLDILLALWLFKPENEQFVLIIFNIVANRSLAFLIVGFITARLVSRLRQQSREVRAVNLELTRYARMLEEFSLNLEQLTLSRERNRLARELHDTLAHTLSALSVQLEATDTVWDKHPEQARELLRESLVTARSGLTETRRALQALRASPLDDLGLRLAVHNLAETAADRGGFRIEIDMPHRLESINAQLEQVVYRVVQEALENIVRHAMAQRVQLRLTRQGKQIKLFIRDDGIGFTPDAVPGGHFGLLGMRERVAVMDGTLEIQSLPGAGTTIHLELMEVLK